MAPRVDDRRRRLGSHGEGAVARWYEERGYTVASRNWRETVPRNCL